VVGICVLCTLPIDELVHVNDTFESCMQVFGSRGEGNAAGEVVEVPCMISSVDVRDSYQALNPW
jgi:hypothetical protein